MRCWRKIYWKNILNVKHIGEFVLVLKDLKCFHDGEFYLRKFYFCYVNKYVDPYLSSRIVCLLNDYFYFIFMILYSGVELQLWMVTTDFGTNKIVDL